MKYFVEKKKKSSSDKDSVSLHINFYHKILMFYCILEFKEQNIKDKDPW